jgi:putative DNA-invertase from lambdoid prophage Rac
VKVHEGYPRRKRGTSRREAPSELEAGAVPRCSEGPVCTRDGATREATGGSSQSPGNSEASVPAACRRALAGLGNCMSKHAAIYLWVSTDEQTVDNQRPDLERVAEARGLAIVATYEERASAAKRRPSFDCMMTDARRSAFDVPLVWSIDRFGRSMAGNVNDALALDDVGVKIVSVREPWLDTGGPVRDLLLAIFSWVAEQELRRLVERTRAGMDRARANGTKSGKPIGRPYRLPPRDVERARAMRAAGRSVRAIAIAMKASRSTVARAIAAYGDQPEGR